MKRKENYDAADKAGGGRQAKAKGANAKERRTTPFAKATGTGKSSRAVRAKDRRKQFERFAERTVAEALDRCLARGMKLPFILCVAAVDGAVQALRFHGPGITMEHLVKRAAPGGVMRLPLNVMIVDQMGEALRVLITAKGVSFD
jgi:hypothetical protein